MLPRQLGQGLNRGAVQFYQRVPIFHAPDRRGSEDLLLKTFTIAKHKCTAPNPVRRSVPEATPAAETRFAVNLPGGDVGPEFSSYAAFAILIDGPARGCPHSLNRAATSPAARCPDSIAPSM